MVHAHAALPRFELDGKRIAATSGVIALHLAVLMMLMMPMQSATTAPEEEQPFIANWQEIKPITPLPLPKPKDPPRPLTAPAPHPVVAQQEEVIEPVDQTVGTMDIPIAPPLPPPTSFDNNVGASTFAQLSADIAPAPPYPRPAIARRLTGTVTLRIHVDASGKPMEVMVENSSGSPILDQAALKFVKARWHFVPATQDGVAVEAWALVPIEYVLN